MKIVSAHINAPNSMVLHPDSRDTQQFNQRHRLELELECETMDEAIAFLACVETRAPAAVSRVADAAVASPETWAGVTTPSVKAVALAGIVPPKPVKTTLHGAAVLVESTTHGFKATVQDGPHKDLMATGQLPEEALSNLSSIMQVGEAAAAAPQVVVKPAPVKEEKPKEPPPNKPKALVIPSGNAPVKESPSLPVVVDPAAKVDVVIEEVHASKQPNAEPPVVELPAAAPVANAVNHLGDPPTEVLAMTTGRDISMWLVEKLNADGDKVLDQIDAWRHVVPVLGRFPARAEITERVKRQCSVVRNTTA